jgi:hypothetical protein
MNARNSFPTTVQVSFMDFLFQEERRTYTQHRYITMMTIMHGDAKLRYNIMVGWINSDENFAADIKKQNNNNNKCRPESSALSQYSTRERERDVKQ